MVTGVIEPSPPLRLENAVRRLRLERLWSVEELAVRAGVSSRVVRNVETIEGHQPTSTVMLRIAAAFGLRLCDVFWSDDGQAA